MELQTYTKIGVMGGTFNPVHYGHLLIAENAYEQYGLEHVFFMPTGRSPHKDGRQIISAAQRCEMVRLAIDGNPHFSCSDYETTKADVSYTYLTLQAFTQRFPGTELYFIMGADSLADFEHWLHPEEISRLSTILVAVRDELNIKELMPIREHLKKAYHAKIAFINTPGFSVSSRLIRKRVTEHSSIRYLVPDAVEQYIRQHHIYIETQ